MILDRKNNRVATPQHGGDPRRAPTHTEGLYRPEFEKDNCGFGLIANMDGEPSHWVVKTAVESLVNLTHRGAVAADRKSGDGCGLLLNKPDKFLRAAAKECGISVDQEFAVGTVFLNPDPEAAESARREVEKALQSQGLSAAGWRKVPTDDSALGAEALRSKPMIEQLFINAKNVRDSSDFECKLYQARRRAENRLEQDDATFYICSLSSRVLLYKGLMMPANLPLFYLDLNDDRLESSICVFHQRFSTNTMPQWRLAQPFRYLAHNGEINTIQGNRNWSEARSYKLNSPLIEDMESIRPLVNQSGSDSSSLDNMLEAFLAGGMDIFHAMQIMIPPAWQNVESMDSDVRAFYRYNSMHMEPWDGPAGIVLTDGRYAGCVLDRNGLRPARYVITRDRHITLASEVGVYDYQPEEVLFKGRLKPGQMIAIDTVNGELLYPETIQKQLATKHPYKKWMREQMVRLRSTFGNEGVDESRMEPEVLKVYEKLYQVTLEEKDLVLRVLAEVGQEAVGSMGDDTPLPVLSTRIRSLYDSFRQQFAQVTNPPIDPLREQIVMSLETCFGREQNLYDEMEGHASRIVIDSPVLSAYKYFTLLGLDDDRYLSELIELNVPLHVSLEEALNTICNQAVEAVRGGKTILILSDRNIGQETMPVHALLATGAVHHSLIAAGLRCDANIVVETGTARDPHHFAVLVGYGATAVMPYLAYATISSMADNGELAKSSLGEALRAYRKGINKGLYKIISKMGISTIASYRGAQLFEAVGLSREVVDQCFNGTVCRIQGMTYTHIESDQRQLVGDAWNPKEEVGPGGLLKFVHGGEYHAYHPDVIRTIQKAVMSGDYQEYKAFSRIVNQRPAMVLRDLLSLNEGEGSIAVEEVEPEESILKRFDSAGMSLGALSPEAHEALAEAMNSLGGRSNSGEGGEDPERYGTNRMSKIKQIASGRFGVTPAYLVNAEVLQIKIAQGAKPGEGGQLPGHKVDKLIARLRFASPGIPLISPPPHHDIYSIEDLAQLIFDLKQVNPDALVSVKLVAEAGIGTIAAGVTKAYADLITISGYDGGTGASPLTSVKYCGSPWELGLTETHQTLRANNLRNRVRLQADGGLKTGLDVIKAAILGAESFGFGTMPMVALGCKYLRICHLNNCATGVATQDKRLRENHFHGSALRVARYFSFIAREVREILASLGVRRIDDLIGRTDLLKQIEGKTLRQQHLDLSPVLSDGGVSETSPQYCTESRNTPWDQGELAEKMVAEILPAIESSSGGEFHFSIRNIHRSIGARLSGEIAKRHGDQGMEESPVVVNLQGTAGQSFGVWNAGGLHLRLTGDANDYVGKGMAGGKITITPPPGSSFKSNESTIIGNTCLYGATGGELYAAGRAGERFAVRNSGASAVIEGCGDHGCEYMTGGVVTVLGQTGLNFGAGMTGGFAFVLDCEDRFTDSFNRELIEVHRLIPESMEPHVNYLLSRISSFVEETQSEWGQNVCENFLDYVGKFWLVKPKVVDLETLLDNLFKEAA